MVDLRPFRGWVYDRQQVDIGRVLAPPYDVISEDERSVLARSSEHNAVHLILPSPESDTRYADAAATYSGWKEAGALRQSAQPAIYRYHQVFAHPLEPTQTMTRRGIVAAVRLHDFSERVILPHERTLKGPKIDRLNLMRATQAHLSQIFTLYSDPSGSSERLFESIESKTPAVDAVTADETRHRVWEVSDPSVIDEVRTRLAQESLYIADGHHRYETMLAYRDELRKKSGDTLAPDSIAQFGTLFIANMDDPGMVVMPTHRVIHGVDAFDAEKLESRGQKYFDIETVDGTSAAIREALSKRDRPCFAVVAGAEKRASVWTLNEVSTRLNGVLADLDVTVLHELVLEDLLGIDKEAQAAKSNIRYLKTDEAAFSALDNGQGQVCFMMRATPLAHVRAVSDQGEFMPQKSTFFVPKIASGVVYRDIDVKNSLVV